MKRRKFLKLSAFSALILPAMGLESTSLNNTNNNTPKGDGTFKRDDFFEKLQRRERFTFMGEDALKTLKVSKNRNTFVETFEIAINFA